jgi:hypothetical protein
MRVVVLVMLPAVAGGGACDAAVAGGEGGNALKYANARAQASLLQKVTSYK